MRVVRLTEALLRHLDEEIRDDEHETESGAIEGACCLAPSAGTGPTKAGGTDRADAARKAKQSRR